MVHPAAAGPSDSGVPSASLPLGTVIAPWPSTLRARDRQSAGEAQGRPAAM